MKTTTGAHRGSTSFVSLVLLALGLAVGLSACGRVENNGLSQEILEAAEKSSEEVSVNGKQYFEKYLLKAVDQIYAKYKWLGYDINAVYTHDLPFGKVGVLKSTKGTNTMCVAAMIEIIVAAFQIYEKETGDKAQWTFLPFTSWNKISVNDFKGHVWVNPAFSHGTADALRNFGMGEKVTFDQLIPGSFVNLNRTNPSGHAVLFISYVDKNGKETTRYSPDVIGFKYFSAQGAGSPTGGFDYRYAIFSKYGCPTNLKVKRDCNVIYSTKQDYLNTGRMWAPKSFEKRTLMSMLSVDPSAYPESTIDPNYFNGITTD